MTASVEVTMVDGAASTDPPGLSVDWDNQLEFSTPERFSAVADLVPDHLALSGSDGLSLTYRQLHAETMRLAGEIVDRLGPDPGHVGLLADPNASAVVGMLGILAAGKSYVPIDPAEPPTVAAAKMSSAAARIVLAPSVYEQSARAMLGNSGSFMPLDVGDGGGHFQPEVVAPDAMFNLIFTSGSTGAPKGVVQTHRNVIFDTAASASLYLTTTNDRYGLVVPLSFGASVSDVMGALLNGAELHVMDLRREGIEAMATWMAEKRITVTHMVPTVFRRWMAALDPADHYPDMRLIKLGGESVLRHDFDAFVPHFTDTCLLRNGLGTTETYLIAANLLRRGDAPEEAILPVGTAAPGRSYSILDAEGHRVADGEVGQIAVTSRYLSPGYWRNDEATARAYRSGPGDERTYLTGDLGRILPDGSLHHLGRVDDMVKIRGQRVDPAEVETVLLEHPGVAEAAVTAQPTELGDNRLVGYIVANADPPSTASLRALLMGRLPPHMVPTAFVVLDELPVLRFGKVDRRALPPAMDLRSGVEAEYLAPRDQNEETIVGIASTLLGIERIGVNDDLFDLGLDSLTATQLIGRINQRLDADLLFDAVFEFPTVAGLAARIGQGSPEEAELASILAELEALDEEQARSQLGSG